ncbi:hypothetical protein HDU86_006243 [Geranomyces michiganensis]|nr:hypothetical protein HDU86_006243 [Geranomyces michiganensis]
MSLFRKIKKKPKAGSVDSHASDRSSPTSTNNDNGVATPPPTPPPKNDFVLNPADVPAANLPLLASVMHVDPADSIHTNATRDGDWPEQNIPTSGNLPPQAWNPQPPSGMAVSDRNELADTLRKAASHSSLVRGVAFIPEAHQSHTETAITTAMDVYTTATDHATGLMNNVTMVQTVGGNILNGIDQITGNKLDLLDKVHTGVKDVVAQTPALQSLVSIVDKLMDIGKTAPFVAPVFCVLKLIIDNEQRVRETDAKCNDLVERVAFMSGHVVDLGRLELSASVQHVAGKIEKTLKECLALVKAYRAQGAIVRRLNMGNAAKFSGQAKSIEACTSDLMLCLQIQQTTQLTILQRAIPVDSQDRAAQAFLAADGRASSDAVVSNPALMQEFAQAIGEQVSQQNLAAVGESLKDLLDNAQAETDRQLAAALDAVKAGLRDAMVAKEQLERERLAAPRLKCVQCDTLFQEWEQSDIVSDSQGACRFHLAEWDGWNRSQPCCGEKDRPCGVGKHSARHHLRFPYASLHTYAFRILGYTDTMEEYAVLDEQVPHWYQNKQEETVWAMKAVVAKLLRPQTRGGLLTRQPPAERYRLVLRAGLVVFGESFYFRVVSSEDLAAELGSNDAVIDPVSGRRSKVLFEDKDAGYFLAVREQLDAPMGGFEIEVAASVPWKDGAWRQRMLVDRTTLHLCGEVETLQTLTETAEGRKEREAKELAEAEQAAREEAERVESAAAWERERAEQAAREAAEAETRRIDEEREKERLRVEAQAEEQRRAKIQAEAMAIAMRDANTRAAEAVAAAAKAHGALATTMPTGIEFGSASAASIKALEDRLLGLEVGLGKLTGVLERFLPAIEMLAKAADKNASSD